MLSSILGFLANCLLNRTVLPYWYESSDLLRAQRRQTRQEAPSEDGASEQTPELTVLSFTPERNEPFPLGVGERG
jgi:hypothetical protein